MSKLSGPERPAASGKADSLVVFLHGYGADGNDLIGLADPLAPHLPGTRFLAPNAPERTILFGFSQGTMMALQVAPRRPAAFAGIVGFSGRLLHPERLGAEIVSRPPVLLVHGDADPMVPVASLSEAAAALTAAGVETRTHVSKGVGHGIAPDGLGLALDFIRGRLDATAGRPS